MIRHRQSSIDPGNCLQTCVACILDMPIDALPDQTCFNPLAYAYELRYWLESRAGLRLVLAHHISERSAVAFKEYIMCGLMVGHLGGAAEEHCVVAEGGKIVWDPYPGRPGLKRVDCLWFVEPAAL
jgi:hypothetical protein